MCFTYSYRLVSEYVTACLYEQEELKSLRIRAGEYVEESGDYLEAIYQYKGAGEWDRAFDVAGPLQDWLCDQGYMYEARGIMEGFDPALLDKAHQAHWYHSYGLVELRQWNMGNALVCYEKAVTIGEELGNKAGMATSYGQIGRISQIEEKFNEALDYFIRAYCLFMVLQNPYRQLAGKYILIF